MILAEPLFWIGVLGHIVIALFIFKRLRSQFIKKNKYYITLNTKVLLSVVTIIGTFTFAVIFHRLPIVFILTPPLPLWILSAVFFLSAKHYQISTKQIFGGLILGMIICLLVGAIIVRIMIVPYFM